jgi:stage V sporulation protein D (sporulation-specific penicillin-binding protein)
VIKANEPTSRRQVISKKTSATLRQFCRDVVEEGTGKNAKVDHLDICGKTGTGQKADKIRGYIDDAYVASFVGFMPFDDPRLTCLVLLDEPSYDQRFGGVSAAPVFARISRSLINMTPLFEDVLVTDVVTVKDINTRQVSAPNFLRMDVKDARARARTMGITVLSASEEGHIVEQNPDPGVRMEKDRVIRLAVSNGIPAKGEIVPDLRGLPLREAKRRIIRKGWKCAIKGSGVVVSQTPQAGRRVAGGVVQLSCR